MNYGEAMNALNKRVRYHAGEEPHDRGILLAVSYPIRQGDPHYGRVYADDGCDRMMSIECLELEEVKA